MELIAIVVCVILVSVLALRTFGGQISNTTNETTNTVENLTSTVLNGSGSSGGSGGNGSSTPGIDMSNINSNGVVGDFSAKGNLVTINDTQYRVLAVDGTQAKVMSMESAGNSKFGDGTTTSFGSYTGQKYTGSILDATMTTYYNGLPTAIKSAIVPQNIKQSIYSCSNPMRSSNKVTEIEVGQRYVYVLDIDDVLEYLGEYSPLSPYVVNEMFFNTTSSISKYVWLRSASFHDSSRALYVYGFGGLLDHDYYNNNNEVRPAFVIDLSLLS